MPLEYVGGLPDWCGEAANRKRLEEWFESFGTGGIPCGVCDLRKVREDFRRLAQHLAAGKDKVSFKLPEGSGPGKSWSIQLLTSPPAVVGGQRAEALDVLHLRLTCSRCQHVLLFDARAIGIAV
jgi:hypothetical protein